MIYGIVAIAKNGVIGNNGSVPWVNKDDMFHFKNKTIGNAVVMGRKTFDSLGKPLVARANLVLTSRPCHKDVLVIKDRKDAYRYNQHMDVYIIGGSSVWDMFIGDIETWIITRIQESPNGDTFFQEEKYLKDFKLFTSETKNITIETYVKS